MKSLFVALGMAVFYLFTVGLAGAVAQDQALPAPAHAMPDLPKGMMKGRVYQYGSGEPLAAQNVGLMVFYQQERVLILDKVTDSNGRFSFQNIFQDSEYSYSLGTIFNDDLYIITDLHLPLGQEVLTVEMPVGEGSQLFKGPVAQLMEQVPPGQQGMESSNDPDVARDLDRIYRRIAIVLSALVILLALVLMAQGRGRVH